MNRGIFRFLARLSRHKFVHSHVFGQRSHVGLFEVCVCQINIGGNLPPSPDPVF